MKPLDKLCHFIICYMVFITIGISTLIDNKDFDFALFNFVMAMFTAGSVGVNYDKVMKGLKE